MSGNLRHRGRALPPIRGNHCETSAGGERRPEAEASESARIEAEIRRSLLQKYDGYLVRIHVRGQERFRIYPDGNSDGDIASEILAFYQSESGTAEKSSSAVLRYLAGRHRLLVTFSMANKTLKHLCALLIPVFASNIIGALSVCRSF